MKTRVELELTEEQAKKIYLPYPSEYWVTMGSKVHPEDLDPPRFFLRGIKYDLISKEGIEGLGFKLAKYHAGVSDMDFGMGDYWLEWGDEFILIQEIIAGEELTLFYGKLETMKQLRDVLKWTGVIK